MLTPVARRADRLISETDARELGIEDNDWIEAFNANGALTARRRSASGVPPGMTMMYHAQERIMNIPGSEVTGRRGGIHNSVTCICPKPTHMIGGYAQLAYGFNYYGTVGSNRDEFIMIRKMKTLTGWMTKVAIRYRRAKMKNPPTSWNGAQSRQMHRLPHLLGHRKNVWTGREGMGNTPGLTTSKPNPVSATRKLGKTGEEWQGGWIRGITGVDAAPGNRVGVLAKIRQPAAAGHRRLLRTLHLRLPASAYRAGEPASALPPPSFAD